MKKTLILAGFLISPGVAQADQISQQINTTYLMSDTDTRPAARQACLSKAAKIVLEQAGSLVSSSQTLRESEKNGIFSSNLETQINSWVGTVVGTKFLHESVELNEDHFRLTCQVQVTFDPVQLQSMLAAFAQAEREANKAKAMAPINHPQASSSDLHSTHFEAINSALPVGTPIDKIEQYMGRIADTYRWEDETGVRCSSHLYFREEGIDFEFYLNEFKAAHQYSHSAESHTQSNKPAGCP